jgi:hypothetical protein
MDVVTLTASDFYGKQEISEFSRCYLPILHIFISHPFICCRTRMPCQLTPLKLVEVSEEEDLPSSSFDAMRIAAISTVAFEGNPVPGGMITHLWAFMSPQGKRAMFVLAEQGHDRNKMLHVRSDDKYLLLCLAGTSSARDALISALQPGMKPHPL